MTIVLQETLRGVFYAPFYAALAARAFEQEGVAVRFVSSPTPDASARGLVSGAVDVGWGGPLRVMKTYEEDPASDLVCFCEVVTRDPFFLVGRTPRPDFAPADLVGRSFASVSEVPTPWLCLQDDLRRAGIDPAALDRRSGRSMAENAAALRRGEIEVVQLFQPFVEELVGAGAGHVWYAAADRGLTSYTTLYARRAVLAQRRDELKRMVRAVYRSLQWVERAPGAEIARVVAGYFPDVPQPRLAAALDRYKRHRLYGRDPRLPRDGYERLRAAMISGGYVRAGRDYEAAVDNSLAEEVIAEPPPPLAP